MLDDLDLDIPEASPPPEPPRSSNRGFLVAVGILGSIMLLGLIAMVYYALVILPEQRAAGPSIDQLTQTAVARAVQVTSTNTPAASQTSTATLQPPSATPRNTNTPLITNTSAATTGAPVGGATATVNALLTQAALAQTQALTSAASPTATTTPPTATNTASALPQSGFAEDVGAPGLLLGAVILLAVIFVTRRLRTA